MDYGDDDEMFEEYLYADAGMSGAGGLPGSAATTTVGHGGTGIGRGEGGNIPSHNQRKKKKRPLAGNGTPAERRKESGGYQESIGVSGY